MCNVRATEPLFDSASSRRVRSVIQGSILFGTARGLGVSHPPPVCATPKPPRTVALEGVLQRNE